MMPAKKKTEKIPYQEYQKLKAKEAGNKFKFTPYPWPVLIYFLIPLAIFIFGMTWYFMNVHTFMD